MYDKTQLCQLSALIKATNNESEKKPLECLKRYIEQHEGASDPKKNEVYHQDCQGKPMPLK